MPCEFCLYKPLINVIGCCILKELSDAVLVPCVSGASTVTVWGCSEIRQSDLEYILVNKRLYEILTRPWTRARSIPGFPEYGLFLNSNVLGYSVSVWGPE